MLIPGSVVFTIARGREREREKEQPWFRFPLGASEVANSAPANERGNRPPARSAMSRSSSDADVEEVREDDVASSFLSELGSSLTNLPIIFTKVKQCLTCAHKSNEKSPLNSASDTDRFGGLWPWGKYHRSKDKQSKAPQGKFCLICVNVYRALPDSLTVAGGMQKFSKHLFEKMEKVHSFRRSCSHWIKCHNSSAGRTVRLRDQAGLAEAQTLTAEHSTGMKRKIDMTFIELDVYEASYGDPEANGHKVVTHVVDGKEEKGCWVSSEAKGHHRYEMYEDKKMNHTTVLDNGKSMLTRDQIANKYAAASSQITAPVQKRWEKSGSKNLAELLQLANQMAHGPTNTGDDESSADGKGGDDDGDSDDADDSSDDLGGTGAAVVGALALIGLGPAAATTKAKTKAQAVAPSAKISVKSGPSLTSKASGISTPTSSPSMKSVASGMRAKTPPATVKSKRDSEPREVAALDGRGERVAEAVRASLKIVDESADRVLDLRGLKFKVTGPGDAQLQAEVRKRLGIAGTLSGKMRDAIQRIERSKAKIHMESELHTLKDQEAAVKCAMEILKHLSSPKPPAEALLRCIEASQQLSIDLGTSIWLLQLECKGRMCLEFEKYQELCQEVLVESAAVCQNLMNNHGVQRDGLDEVACRLLEESIMVYLRTMKDAAKDKDKKATLRSLVELCKHILAECRDTARAHYFLAAGLKNDIQHLTNILDPGACDVKALQDTLKKVAATKDLENGSMIMQNLATHVACAGLLKSAKDCAEQREDEAFYSTEFDAVEKAIGETPTDVDDIVAIGKQLAPFVQCNSSLSAVADQVKQRKAPWLVERATKLIQALGERVTQYLQAVLHEVVTQISQRNPVDVVGMNASLVTAMQLACDLDEKRLKEQWNLVKLMSEMFCFTDKVSLKMDMPSIVDAFSQQNNARLRAVLACERDMVDMLNALGMSAAVKRAVRDELDTMDALFGQVVVHSKGEINNSFKSLVSGNQRMAPLVQQSDKAIEIAAFCQDDVAPFIALRGMAALYWDTLLLLYRHYRLSII